MRDASRQDRFVFLAYLILAVVMTWPLFGRLGSHLPLGNADLWLNYWNLWWWKTSLLGGQSPYSSDMIFHPTGMPLGLHTHSPANMLWTLPVNILFGIGPALNLAIFSGFVMAGLGGYLLAFEYTRSRPAAFLGGIAAAYYPQHVDQATEHLNLASYWAMPLFLWALVRCIRRGGRRWWLATGLFFALNALFSWHNALLSIPLGIGVALFESWRGSRPLRGVTIELAAAAAAAFLVMGPFLWPVIRDTLAGSAALQKPFFDKPLVAATFWLPHPGHPLWGAWFTDLHLEMRTYASVGSIGYLGVVTLILAACTLIVRQSADTLSIDEEDAIPRGSRFFWWTAFLFLIILSLGESLREVPLPYGWLKSLPVFGLVRIPNRFLVPAMLALAVLAAMGADRLLARWPDRQRTLFMALGLAMLIDYAWLPFPMREQPQPEWLETLAEHPRGTAILDVPLSHGPPGAFENYLQTEHGLPIVGGYTATSFRAARQQYGRHPALWKVRVPYRPVKAGEVEESLAGSLSALDAGLVVVHLTRTQQQIRAMRHSLDREAPNYYHRIRLFDPKSGLPRKAMEAIRRELTADFGEPILSTPLVEIYRVSSPTELP